VAIGAQALSSTASLAGIMTSPPGRPDRVRETLPYEGYGQGDVLATPLRMARVAAAIGSDGTIRDASLVQGDTKPVETPFLTPSAAKLLAGYMRDVVTEGTG